MTTKDTDNIAPRTSGVKPRLEISQDRLKEFLHYNPESGEFTWIKKTTNACRNPAGCFVKRRDKSTYVVIRLDGVLMQAHRLAWIWVHGSIPEGLEVDHEDRNPSNNRLQNLRLATHQQNCCNVEARRTAHGKPRLLAKGVRINRQGRYVARIVVNKEQIHIGTYDTQEEAAEAYRQRSRELHGAFSRH